VNVTDVYGEEEPRERPRGTSRDVNVKDVVQLEGHWKKELQERGPELSGLIKRSLRDLRPPPNEHQGCRQCQELQESVKDMPCRTYASAPEPKMGSDRAKPDIPEVQGTGPRTFGSSISSLMLSAGYANNWKLEASMFRRARNRLQ